MAQRWREGGVIHVESADGVDFTLCGYALEGNPGEQDQVECVAISRGKISCGRCLAIIRFSKSIPARMLADRRAQSEDARKKGE